MKWNEIAFPPPPPPDSKCHSHLVSKLFIFASEFFELMKRSIFFGVWFSSLSTIISSHDHWLTTHLMFSYFLSLLWSTCSLWQKRSHIHRKSSLSFFPSFLPCLQCFLFLFCRNWFSFLPFTGWVVQVPLFSVIPQTLSHWNNKDQCWLIFFFFINNSIFRIESHRIFSFSVIVFTCESSHYCMSTRQTAS